MNLLELNSLESLAKNLYSLSKLSNESMVRLFKPIRQYKTSSQKNVQYHLTQFFGEAVYLIAKLQNIGLLIHILLIIKI